MAIRVVNKGVIRGRTQVTILRFGPRSRQLTSIRLIAAKQNALTEDGVTDCPVSDPVEIAKLLGEIKEGQEVKE